MATGLEQFIGMYQPKGWQDVMAPLREQAMRQQQLQMQQELMPFKEQLMQAQAQRAMQPAQPNVWEQKMNLFEQLARQKGLSEDQINTARGRFLLADLMKQGGQQINMELPGGGSLNIGGGADTSGMGDVFGAFGVQPGPSGIPATKTEQSAIEKQMRGLQQASAILPEVQKYIKYKDPIEAAKADVGGLAHKYAPGLASAVGLPTSEGLAHYQSALGEVKESLLNAYGLRSTDKTQEDVQKIIEGARFEKPEAAAQRIDNLMKRLRKRYEASAKNLVQGYQPEAQIEEPKAKPQFSEEDIAHTAKLKGMTVEQVKQMLEQQ